MGSLFTSAGKKGKRASTRLGLNQLAKQIGVDKAQLSHESKRRGFPSQTEADGTISFDKDEVIAWRAKNIRQRSAGAKKSDDGLANSEALASADDPFIVAMMSGDASPTTISRAAMQMASRRVAKGAISGEMTRNDIDGLKTTLAELRAAELGYIELAVTQKNLIPRDAVLAIVGENVAILLRVLGVIEASLATEVATWMGDPEFLAMNAGDRAAKIREWFSRKCRDVRTLEADGLETLIDRDRSETD